MIFTKRIVDTARTGSGGAAPEMFAGEKTPGRKDSRNMELRSGSRWWRLRRPEEEGYTEVGVVIAAREERSSGRMC